MATEMLYCRIDPDLKKALDQEVRRRQDAGNRRATITEIVIEAIQEKLRGVKA